MDTGLGKVLWGLAGLPRAWGGWVEGWEGWGVIPPVYPLLTPLPFLQRCFQTTNGHLSDSRSCSSNYSVAALATSSLVGELRLPPPALGI